MRVSQCPDDVDEGERFQNRCARLPHRSSRHGLNFVYAVRSFDQEARTPSYTSTRDPPAPGSHQDPCRVGDERPATPEGQEPRVAARDPRSTRSRPRRARAFARAPDRRVGTPRSARRVSRRAREKSHDAVRASGRPRGRERRGNQARVPRRREGVPPRCQPRRRARALRARLRGARDALRRNEARDVRLGVAFGAPSQASETAASSSSSSAERWSGFETYANDFRDRNRSSSERAHGGYYGESDLKRRERLARARARRMPRRLRRGGAAKRPPRRRRARAVQSARGARARGGGPIARARSLRARAGSCGAARRARTSPSPRRARRSSPSPASRFSGENQKTERKYIVFGNSRLGAYL